MSESEVGGEDPGVPPEQSLRFQRSSLLFFVLGISVVFLWMIGGFLTPLLLAAIFAGMARPVYVRILRLFGDRQTLSAVSVVILMLLLILGPLTGFLTIVAGQALEVSQRVQPWVQEQLEQPGGLTVRDVLAVIESCPPLVGADIVELNPHRDHQDVTAMVAVKLLKEVAAQMLTA